MKCLLQSDKGTDTHLLWVPTGTALPNRTYIHQGSSGTHSCFMGSYWYSIAQSYVHTPMIVRYTLISYGFLLVQHCPIVRTYTNDSPLLTPVLWVPTGRALPNLTHTNDSPLVTPVLWVLTGTALPNPPHTPMNVRYSVTHSTPVLWVPTGTVLPNPTQTHQ